MISSRRPVGGLICQNTAEQPISVRELDPGLDPPSFIEPDHEASLIVQVFKMCLDTNLGGEIAFCLECVKVAAIAHKAIVCLSPKVRVGFSGYEEFGIRKICFVGSLSHRPFLRLCICATHENSQTCSTASRNAETPRKTNYCQQTRSGRHKSAATLQWGVRTTLRP